MLIESSDGLYSYRFGVIDFMTRHTVLKKFETELKSIINWVDKGTISAQKPDVYQERFMKYFKNEI